MARTYKRDSRGRFAGGGGSSGSKGSSKRKAPATSSARGRALENQRRATVQVRANRGGTGPSKKAVRSAVTAMQARAYYAATGTGTKRSARKTVSAAAKGKAARAEARAKGKAAGEKAAEGGTVAAVRSSATPKSKRRAKTDGEILAQADRIISKGTRAAAKATSSIGKNGLDKTRRVVGRSIRRTQYVVPAILKRKGLLGEYARLTAVKDDFLRTPAGPGIKPPRRRR